MMLRICTLTTLAVGLCLVTTACSGSDDSNNNNTPTANVAPLFPANNEVGSWVEDATAINPFFGTTNPAGVEVATDFAQATAAVDGDADVFNNHHFVAFAREWYTDGTEKLELRVWQFADAATAKALYDALPTEDSRYNNTWQTAAFGDAGRMLNTGVSFWYNVAKNAYFVEIQGLKPNNAAAQTAGEAFLTAVLAKAP